MHDGKPVRHRHGLALIVRDEQRGYFQFPEPLKQFLLQFESEPVIQTG